MSLLLLDSFDDLNAWSIKGSSSDFDFITGRSGSGNAVRTFTASSKYLWQTVPSSQEHATFIVGFACYVTGLPTYLDDVVGLCQLTSDNGQTVHLTLALRKAEAVHDEFVPDDPADPEGPGTWVTVGQNIGRLQIYRGKTTFSASPVLLGEAPSDILLSVWNYIEVKATLHDTTGAYDVRLNNASVLSQTGIDTKAGGTKTVFDGISIGTCESLSSAQMSCRFDDFYLANGTGSVNNSFLGDLMVETVFPDGTNTTGWTGSDGNAVDNHLLVNTTVTAAADPDYVYAGTVGARDVYTTADTTRRVGSIPGVVISANAGKDDPGAKGLKLVVKEGGGAIRTSPDNPIRFGCTEYPYGVDRKNDGSAWTVSDVDNLGIGVEVGS